MSRYYLITLKNDGATVPIEDGSERDAFIDERLAGITFHPNHGSDIKLTPENVESYEEVDEETYKRIEQAAKFPPIEIPPIAE